MKKSQLRQIIRESISELLTEQNLGFNIGDRVFFAAGAYNLSNPQDLPGYDPSMFMNNWQNSGLPAQSITSTTSNCCNERQFEVDSNNITDIENYYFNGGTLKPGVYMSKTVGAVTGMGVAQAACNAVFTSQQTNNVISCTYTGAGPVTPVTPVTPVDKFGNEMAPEDFTSISTNTGNNFNGNISGTPQGKKIWYPTVDLDGGGGGKGPGGWPSGGGTGHPTKPPA